MPYKGNAPGYRMISLLNFQCLSGGYSFSIVYTQPQLFYRKFSRTIRIQTKGGICTTNQYAGHSGQYFSHQASGYYATIWTCRCGKISWSAYSPRRGCSLFRRINFGKNFVGESYRLNPKASKTSPLPPPRPLFSRQITCLLPCCLCRSVARSTRQVVLGAALNARSIFLYVDCE